VGAETVDWGVKVGHGLPIEIYLPYLHHSSLRRKSENMIRPILIHPDPRLKKPCEAVADVTPEVRTLALDMLETMYDAPGVGLAAPQVGIMKRVIVMDCIKDGPPEPMTLINPRIVWASEDVNIYEEGCLSIPEQYADVKRPASVTVEWMDLEGATQERTFTGLWATCVQHEIDHLDGKLFIDYLGPLKRQMITRKMEKLKRERARSS
jgi:peptide deformylase